MIVVERGGRVIVNGIETDGTAQAILAAKRAGMICTARQARLAMISTPHGQGTLLEAVQDAVAASNDRTLKVSWEYATEWPRTAPEIAQIAGVLGLTDDDLDALFALALTF